MVRKNLLKLIASGLICAISAVSFIGCANNTTQSNTNNSSESSKTESATESREEISDESQEASNSISDETSSENSEDVNSLSIKDEEFWVQFIKDNSKTYNHATTDEIRVAPTDWINNAPPLEVLKGDENWKINDKDDVLNTTIEAGKKALNTILYNYGNYYYIEISVYNDGEASMTGKECIENGWYIINHFYSGFSEYSQLNKDAEDADDFLLYVEKRLGDPNEIHVCDTDDAYDHIECCNYQSTDGITHATMYYYYVYKYTDRTLVVQVREYYTLDENLNITDVDYEEADSIGLEQYYCPSGFDLSKHRILSTIRSFG